MNEEKSEELNPCFCKHTPEVYHIKSWEDRRHAYGEVRCVNVTCPIKPIVSSYNEVQESGSDLCDIIAINKWNLLFTPTFTKEDVEMAWNAFSLEHERIHNSNEDLEYADMLNKCLKVALNAVGRVEE